MMFGVRRSSLTGRTGSRNEIPSRNEGVRGSSPRVGFGAGGFASAGVGVVNETKGPHSGPFVHTMDSPSYGVAARAACAFTRPQPNVVS